MVGAYFDTSVLLKGYFLDQGSTVAVGYLAREEFPIPFTHFQELEMRNAVRLKLFRNEIDSAAVSAALANFDGDIKDGRFVRPDYP